MIKWFNDIEGKGSKYLLNGYVRSYYPSIILALISKAIEYFDAMIVAITEIEKKIIIQAKQRVTFL